MKELASCTHFKPAREKCVRGKWIRSCLSYISVKVPLKMLQQKISRRCFCFGNGIGVESGIRLLPRKPPKNMRRKFTLLYVKNNQQHKWGQTHPHGGTWVPAVCSCVWSCDPLHSFVQKYMCVCLYVCKQALTWCCVTDRGQCEAIMKEWLWLLILGLTGELHR